MITCEICGREFKLVKGFSSHIRIHKITIKDYYNNYLKKDNEGICYCEKPTNFYGLKKGYLKYCSCKCRSNSEEVEIKKKQTMLENYGVEFTFQKEEFQEKSNLTSLKRYGVKYPMQSEIVKDKQQQTMLENYGVKHALQNKKIIKKISGKNHYSWIIDREQRYAPYTEKFHNKELRQQIRSEQDNLDPISNELLQDNSNLHHINYNKTDDRRCNLMFLNVPTHIKTNHNRKKWQPILTEINKEIINE